MFRVWGFWILRRRVFKGLLGLAFLQEFRGFAVGLLGFIFFRLGFLGFRVFRLVSV